MTKKGGMDVRKRLPGMLFLAVICAGAIWIVTTSVMRADALYMQDLASMSMKELLTQSFPGQEFLRRTQVVLRSAGGSKEQNNVFLAGDALMKNVQPADGQVIEQNVASLLAFGAEYQKRSYVMLLPTACAVQQNKVPYSTITPLYNQKQLIDDVYKGVSGQMVTIDTYPLLRSHQDEYIFYRTDSNPTGLGGHYIYSAIAKKMGFDARGLSEFTTEHLTYDFRGDLYETSPYDAIVPDRISIHLFSRYWRSYTVTHYDQNGARRYYTLYPYHKKELGSEQDVILGGMSPIVDVEVANPQHVQQLLVFGDRTAQSYLPFLLIHFGRITFVDTGSVTPEQLENIQLSGYNQVLFAWSVDSFITDDQFSRIEAWLAQN